MITSPIERINEYQASGCWEGVTLHGLLSQQLHLDDSLTAVIDPLNRAELTGDEPRRLTYQQLEDASTALAVDWLRRGITASDRVMVQLPNCAELVLCYFAASKLGAIISPLPMQYGRHELRHIHQVLGASLYVTVHDYKGQPFAAEREALFSDCGSVLVFSADAPLQLDATEQDRRLLQVFQNQNPVDDANRTLSICWTSGTTGLPKGVPRSHNMWVAVARNCIEAGDYRRGERLLNPFPLVNMASIASFLYPLVLLGCPLVLHHPFVPHVFLQQLQQEKINFTIAPPAMLNQLAKSTELWSQFDFSSLRAIGSGSAPLAPWMINIFDREYAKPIINFYGSNEGISFFSKPETAPDAETRAALFPRFGARDCDWQGRAATMISSRVVSPGGGDEISEPGIAGELAVKGPTLFDGYLDADNRDLFTADGFFLTGDLVEICGEDNRYYRIVGRCKDIINRGGMKLSPTEIDVLLEGLPGVKEVAVCAYPDAILGERICTCVVPEFADKAPDLNDVVAYLKAKGLADIKMPERLQLLDALPRNPLGKVQRFILQQQILTTETTEE